MHLTKNDIHNLLVFLDRVQLSGNEALTFVALCEKLKKIGDANANNPTKQDVSGESQS